MLFVPSNLKPTQMSLGFSSCLVLGFFSLIVGVQTPVLSGQGFVERPAFEQRPSQVYRGRQSFQGQPIQGQPIQGQPIQGGIIQGQPIQGGIIQGQPIQGGIIQGQPIQGQPIQGQPIQGVPNFQTAPPAQVFPAQTVPPIVPAPATGDNDAQKSLEAARLAYQEAIDRVKNLSEKNEALITQNEGVLEQFDSLKKENIALTNRVGELGQVNENYEATVLDLREKLAQAGQQVPGNTEETEQLRLRYRESVDQVKKYEAEIGSLTTENQNYQVKISELTAAQEAMNSQANDNMQAELNQKIRILGDEKQSLVQQNEANIEQIRILSQEKQSLVQQLGESQKLSERVSQLTASNEAYVSEIAALNAREVAPAVVEAPPVVEPVIEPGDESITDVSSYESDISRLTRKNRALTESNSELEKHNRSLTRKLGKLEQQPIDLDRREVVAESPALVKDAAVAGLPVVPKAGGSILSWLLPFLAIGLGIAFFVILREEIHRPPTTSGARLAGDTGKSYSKSKNPRQDNLRRDNDDRN